MKDCSIDTITIPTSPATPYGPITYTIHAAKETAVMTPFETEHPTACPIEYRLLDSTDTEISASTIAGMVSLIYVADPF